jgi:hypothetical protein
MGVLARTVQGNNEVDYIVVNNVVEHEIVKMYDVNGNIIAEAEYDDGQVILTLNGIVLPLISATLRLYGTANIANKQLGIGDGVQTQWQLQHNMIVPNTLVVYIDLVVVDEYDVDLDNGKIYFYTPPISGSIITCDYKYYSPIAEAVDVIINGGDQWEFTYRLDIKIDGHLYPANTTIYFDDIVDLETIKPIEIASPNLLPLYHVDVRLQSIDNNFGINYIMLKADGSLDQPSDRRYIDTLFPHSTWYGQIIIRRNPNPPYPHVTAMAALNVTAQSMLLPMTYTYIDDFVNGVIDNVYVEDNILKLNPPTFIWTSQLDFNVDPVNQNWSKDSRGGSVSFTNGVMHIWGTLLSYFRPISSNTVIAEAKIDKVNASDNAIRANPAIQIEGGGKFVRVNPCPTQVNLIGALTKVIDIDFSIPHIIRLIKVDDVGYLYIDGHLAESVACGNVSYSRIWFGNGTLSGNGDSYWDWFRYTDNVDNVISNGSYTSPVITPDKPGKITQSQILWTQTGEQVTVETRISMDGGATWTNWATATNGAAIPNLFTNIDTSLVRLQYRIILSTSDPDNIPTVSGVVITIQTL